MRRGPGTPVGLRPPSVPGPRHKPGRASLTLFVVRPTKARYASKYAPFMTITDTLRLHASRLQSFENQHRPDQPVHHRRRQTRCQRRRRADKDAHDVVGDRQPGRFGLRANSGPLRVRRHDAALPSLLPEGLTAMSHPSDREPTRICDKADSLPLCELSPIGPYISHSAAFGIYNDLSNYSLYVKLYNYAATIMLPGASDCSCFSQNPTPICSYSPSWTSRSHIHRLPDHIVDRSHKPLYMRNRNGSLSSFMSGVAVTKVSS